MCFLEGNKDGDELHSDSGAARTVVIWAAVVIVVVSVMVYMLMLVTMLPSANEENGVHFFWSKGRWNIVIIN